MTEELQNILEESTSTGEYEPISVKGEIMKRPDGSWELLLKTEAYALHSYDLNRDGDVKVTIIGYRILYNELGKEWQMTGAAHLILDESED